MGGKVTVTLDSKVWPLGAEAVPSSAGAPAGPKS